MLVNDSRISPDNPHVPKIVPGTNIIGCSADGCCFFLKMEIGQFADRRFVEWHTLENQP